MKTFLTKEEQNILLEAHRAERIKKRADRIKTVLLLDKGYSYKQISEVLFIDDTTARRYLKTYIEEGLDALIEDNYQGGISRLSKEQETELIKHLKGKIYCTAKEIRDYIMNKYEIFYKVEGTVKLLHRLGFVYKKAKQVPGKADPESQKEFLKLYYQIKNSLGENEKVYFADATHPHHNSMPAYGWIAKGKIKEIKSNTGRKRMNINGVINPDDPADVIARNEETINAEAMIELFKAIEAKNPKVDKIYVIADNARYNRAKLVTQYLKDSKITMIYLPTYSPNLNLIERLWKFFHKKVCYNQYYESFDIFKKTVLDFFNDIWKYQHELSSIITENFQITGQYFSQT